MKQYIYFHKSCARNSKLPVEQRQTKLLSAYIRRGDGWIMADLRWNIAGLRTAILYPTIIFLMGRRGRSRDAGSVSLVFLITCINKRNGRQIDWRDDDTRTLRTLYLCSILLHKQENKKNMDIQHRICLWSSHRSNDQLGHTIRLP